MQRIVNAIKYVDIVSPDIKFKYDENSRMKSALGGLFTIVMLVVAGLGFGYFSKDMFFKMNPITKTNTVTAEEKKMPFSDYPVAFLLTDEMVNAIEPGHPMYESFEFLPQYYISSMVDNELVMQIGNMGVRRCSEEYYGKFGKEYGGTVNKGAFCIDYSQTFNLDGTPSKIDLSLIKKNYGTGEGAIDLRIKLCDEEKKPGCSKPFLDAGQVHIFIYTLNEIVNMDDYSNPVEQQIDFIFSTMGPGVFTRKLLRVSLNKLITDDGYILPNTSTSEFMATSLFDTSVASYSPANRELFAYYFSLTTNEEVLERKYVKLQEILANIGGFMKLLMMCSSTLTRSWSTYSFYKQFGEKVNRMIKDLSKKEKEPKNLKLVKPSSNFVNVSKQELKVSEVSKNNYVDTQMGFTKFLTSISMKSKNRGDNVFRFLDIAYLAEKLIHVEMLY